MQNLNFFGFEIYILFIIFLLCLVKTTCDKYANKESLLY
jgi:hypothetical protein